MIFDKAHCLYVFIFLYGGIILTLFIRAFVRQRLIKDYMELKGDDITKGITNRLLKPFVLVLRKNQALKKLRKTILEASETVQHRHKYFQLLTWIALVLLTMLVIFSFVANKICG